MFISTTTVLERLAPLCLDAFFLENDEDVVYIDSHKLKRIFNNDDVKFFGVLLRFLDEKAKMNGGIIHGIFGRYKIYKIYGRRRLTLKVERIKKNGGVT